MKGSSGNGFSLVELMIVVSIIAILSVIGLAVYSGVQKNARDARRKADIISIARALESQKVGDSVNYPALASTFFSSNTIPVDPINSTSTACNSAICQYCFTMSSTPITTCQAPAPFGVFYITSSTTSPVPNWSALSATWTVCANLEVGGAFCISNAQ